MGAYWSVHSRDGSSFERYLSQLSPFYSLDSLVPSPRMPILLGLHLLYLLVTGRQAAFYMSIAKLAVHLHNDPHVLFILQLQQCLLEGTYHRLLVAKSQVPVPEYAWFIEALIETVRLDIAESMELTYTSISVPVAINMLLLNKEQFPQLEEFGAKRGWKQQGDRIVFPTRGTTSKLTHGGPTSSRLMIQRALSYATELEQIV